MTEISFINYSDKLFGLTIFFSIVLFQILYIMFQWLYIRRNDYLYYIAYMIMILVFGWTQFEAMLPFQFLNRISPLMPYYSRHMVPFLAVFLYYRFSRSFLNLPVTRPALNKWVVKLEYLILATAILSPLSIMLGLSNEKEDVFFLVICSFVIFSSVIIISRFLRQSVPLTRFAMAGAGFILIGSVLQILSIKLIENGVQLVFDPYLPLLLGVIAELLTFTTGLSYKTHLLEKERVLVERKLYEELLTKQKLEHELFSIRDNIARDLHDEIGSGLSKITLLAEVIRKSATPEEARINKIIHSARSMMEGMGEMVWALNTKNDAADNFVLYLRRYCLEFFDDSNIRVDFNMKIESPSLVIPGPLRKNILMVFREVLNNIFKHSQADLVRIYIEISLDHLHISIQDNGSGITNLHTNGNGIKNMRSRIEDCAGVFNLVNNHGLLVKFSIPLNRTAIDHPVA